MEEVLVGEHSPLEAGAVGEDHVALPSAAAVVVETRAVVLAQLPDSLLEALIQIYREKIKARLREDP